MYDSIEIFFVFQVDIISHRDNFQKIFALDSTLEFFNIYHFQRAPANNYPDLFQLERFKRYFEAVILPRIHPFSNPPF